MSFLRAFDELKPLAPLVAAMNVRAFLSFFIFSIIVILAINFLSEPEILNDEFIRFSSSTNCVDAPNVVSIEFQQTSVTLPSHETFLIQATLKDSSGSIVGIDPDWGSSHGSITPIIGLQQARFTPGELESTDIWACAGSVNESIKINVIQGEVVSLNLQSDKENFSADEDTKLNLIGEDIRGNKFELFPSKNNWTFPDGSHLSITDEIIWTPKIAGWHNVSVHDSEISAIISFNVTHGLPVKLSILGDGLLITSDESINLESVLVDKNNNYWPVTSIWSTYNSEASEWLINSGEKATFEAELVGSWKIFAEYSDPVSGQNLLAEYDIMVSVGELSQILLDGHGLTLTVDDVLDLNPRAIDSAGNLIENIEMTWTINGKISTGLLEENGYLFSTEEIGLYEIQVVSEGGGASITCDFINGEAVRILISETGSDQLRVRSGETIELFAQGEDQFGNRFATNVEWDLMNGTGKMDPSSRGIGFYDYKPGDAGGFVVMNYSALGLEDQIVIEVNPGEVAKLRIEYDGEIKQGSTVRLLISAVDNSGKIVSFCNGNTAIVSTDSGTIIRDEDQLYLKFHTSGSNTIDVGCNGQKETFYLQVEDAIFGGVFGDSQKSFTYISLVIMIFIIVLLSLLIIKNRESDEFYELNLPEIENHNVDSKSASTQFPLTNVNLPQPPILHPPFPQSPFPQHSVQHVPIPHPPIEQNLIPNAHIPQTPIQHNLIQNPTKQQSLISQIPTPEALTPSVPVEQISTHNDEILEKSDEVLAGTYKKELENKPEKESLHKKSTINDDINWD